MGWQTGKKVHFNLGAVTRIGAILGDSFSHGGAGSLGDVFAGAINGLATGFGGDCIVPEVSTATQVPQLLVAASAGGDLATPVAYWFKRWPLRVRVGSTNANAVPATSGLKAVITERTEARGVLRLGLADVNAAAQIILDEGGLAPISTAANFSVHFDIANVTNGSIPATAGFADIGIFGGAVGVDPTAVANAAGFFFKLTAGKVYLYSTATTNTLIGTTSIPDKPFILSIEYDATRRTLSGSIDGVGLGSSQYILPAAVTAVEPGARVCHLAAYAAATHAPLGVDIDGLISNQLVMNA